MRQVLGLVAGALLAALGAVVLGEYPLEGTTALIGFPLYGVAVAELVLAIGKRLSAASLASVAAIVATGLTWALWISFGRFRNDVHPPTLSWVMVGIAGVAAVAWGWPRRRSGDEGGSGRSDPGVDDEGGSGRSDPGVDDETGSGPTDRGVEGRSGRSDRGVGDERGAGRSDRGVGDEGGLGRSDRGVGDEGQPDGAAGLGVPAAGVAEGEPQAVGRDGFGPKASHVGAADVGGRGGGAAGGPGSTVGQRAPDEAGAPHREDGLGPARSHDETAAPHREDGSAPSHDEEVGP